jgi:hypothetical protein
VLVVLAALVGTEEVMVSVKEVSVQVALVSVKEVSVREVLAQEAPLRNHHSHCTLSCSLHCTPHHLHQMDIRHNWKRRPICSSNIARPQMPRQW